MHSGDAADADDDAHWLRLTDSINYVRLQDRGCVLLSGSHGGAYSAAKALGVGPRGMVFNDAGGGLRGAGVACLALGERYGVAAATVACTSARIGDAEDMRRRGVISHANAPARAAGVAPGMICAAALRRFAALAPRPPVVAAATENRHEIPLAGALRAVVCIDSASLIRPDDAGRVVVTGSHGGLIGGHPAKAVNAPAFFVAFNDAGVGCEQAGLGRLAPLDQHGIAAVTVDSATAEIGNAVSTLQDGIVSHANPAAVALGVTPGLRLRALAERLCAAADAHAGLSSPARP